MAQQTNKIIALLLAFWLCSSSCRRPLIEERWSNKMNSQTTLAQFLLSLNPAVLRTPAATNPPQMSLLPHDFNLYQMTNLIAEVLDEDGNRVYGAVDAPLLLPLVGGLVVAVAFTAAIPALLAPGEGILEQQRKDEEASGITKNGKWRGR
mmetsp:Transcript_80094/g.124869  ORF Transcript_80094/g.124869 Transcript_80094/m.124869 type:complete len:150 (-) Transcript_80094:193-642(-)